MIPSHKNQFLASVLVFSLLLTTFSSVSESTSHGCVAEEPAHNAVIEQALSAVSLVHIPRILRRVPILGSQWRGMDPREAPLVHQKALISISGISFLVSFRLAYPITFTLPAFLASVTLIVFWTIWDFINSQPQWAALVDEARARPGTSWSLPISNSLKIVTGSEATNIIERGTPEGREKAVEAELHERQSVVMNMLKLITKNEKDLDKDPINVSHLLHELERLIDKLSDPKKWPLHQDYPAIKGQLSTLKTMINLALGAYFTLNQSKTPKRMTPEDLFKYTTLHWGHFERYVDWVSEGITNLQKEFSADERESDSYKNSLGKAWDLTVYILIAREGLHQLMHRLPSEQSNDINESLKWLLKELGPEVETHIQNVIPQYTRVRINPYLFKLMLKIMMNRFRKRHGELVIKKETKDNKEIVHMQWTANGHFSKGSKFPDELAFLRYIVDDAGGQLIAHSSEENTHILDIFLPVESIPDYSYFNRLGIQNPFTNRSRHLLTETVHLQVQRANAYGLLREGKALKGVVSQFIPGTKLKVAAIAQALHTQWNRLVTDKSKSNNLFNGEQLFALWKLMIAAENITAALLGKKFRAPILNDEIRISEQFILDRLLYEKFFSTVDLEQWLFDWMIQKDGVNERNDIAFYFSHSSKESTAHLRRGFEFIVKTKNQITLELGPLRAFQLEKGDTLWIRRAPTEEKHRPTARRSRQAA